MAVWVRVPLRLQNNGYNDIKVKNKRTKEEYENAVKDSLSIAEVCRKLNIKPIGGNYKTVSDAIKKYDINTDHFTGKAWNQGKNYRMRVKPKSLNEILCKNSFYKSYSLKKRLLAEGYKEYKCENPECGLTEWYGKPIPLELHHINGDPTDNRIENLQLLCPNCHAQTDNFRGKNKSNHKNEIECNINRYELISKEESRLFRLQHRRKNKEIKPEKAKRYCKQCKKEIIGNGKRFCSDDCYKEYMRSRIPTKEQLICYSKTVHSISELKRKYKFEVSDNAIIKWCKNYNIYDEIKRNFLYKGYAVEQYDLENNFIRLWRSMNEIHKVLQFSKAGIQRCCRGETKNYQGFIWRYKV